MTNMVRPKTTRWATILIPRRRFERSFKNVYSLLMRVHLHSNALTIFKRLPSNLVQAFLFFNSLDKFVGQNHPIIFTPILKVSSPSNFGLNAQKRSFGENPQFLLYMVEEIISSLFVIFLVHLFLFMYKKTFFSAISIIVFPCLNCTCPLLDIKLY